MDYVITTCIALLVMYLLLTGFDRIIRRKHASTRWRAGPPSYFVREDIDWPRRRVLLEGSVRLVLAGGLIVLLVRLLT